MKQLRELVKAWRDAHDNSLDFYYSGEYGDCADELEKILDAIDQESAPKVDGVSNTDTGRGTYFPDRKVVGS